MPFRPLFRGSGAALAVVACAASLLAPASTASAAPVDRSFLPAGTFTNSVHLDVDAADRLVVGDVGRSAVRWYEPTGELFAETPVRTRPDHVIALAGGAVIWQDGGPAARVGQDGGEDVLALPTQTVAVTASADGAVYSLDGLGVLRSSPGPGSGFEPIAPTGEVKAHTEIAVSPAGDVAVCGSRLMRVSGGVATVVDTAPYTLGCEDVLFHDSDLYVAWSGGAIMRYDSAGRAVSLAVPEYLTGASEMAVRPSGDLIWSGGSHGSLLRLRAGGGLDQVAPGRGDWNGGYGDDFAIDSAGTSYVSTPTGSIDRVSFAEFDADELYGYPTIPIAAATITDIRLMPQWSSHRTISDPFSIVAGTLPRGLSFDARTGEIRGKVATPGTYTVTVALYQGFGVPALTTDVTIVVGSRARGSY